MPQETPKQVGEHSTHPNAIKALEENREATQWKPGESGNKQGYSLKSRLDDAMGKPLTKPSDDAIVIDKLVYSTIEGALNREPTPFREVWDRTEGKVIEKHALLGSIDLVVRYVDKGE